MFDRISPTYDLVNRVISLGIDQRWRKKATSLLPKDKPLRLLDLATGTGDQLIAALKSRSKIEEAIGLDLASEMLKIGEKRIAKMRFTQKCHLVVGSATAIPYPEDNFDAATISFGIRNVTDASLCLKEMHRVLKEEGKAIILEFSLPKNPFFLKLFLFYLRKVVPFLGGFLSKERTAYTYLNATVETFPHGDAFLMLMRQAGFKKAAAYPQTFGVVTLYVGEK
jgi:demethylmenaquinone methyltransferase/2-methoxy-6-polyprenyl-1,4-benzoquinol methylase